MICLQTLKPYCDLLLKGFVPVMVRPSKKKLQSRQNLQLDIMSQVKSGSPQIE